MSAQFGRWNLEGQRPAPGYMDKVRSLLTPYGPDGNKTYSARRVDIHYSAFHTTKESYRETQPYVSSSGAVITWDGRLDNRSELIRDLPESISTASTDVDIVGAAYETWGLNCFSRFIGDWALSIWNPSNPSLYLAKDFIGTRHLYYHLDNNQVSWSTVPDPLVLLEGKTFEICEEYVAGWLLHLPPAHLTPYVGINAVPTASYVMVQPGNHGMMHTVIKYWDFNPGKKIRYRTDAEYEEHFRTLFAKAVQRTLRSDRPVLAELSGGMDSSSIVCMADASIARGEAETPRLDTISWFDDAVPQYDERPYFTKVEKQRGRTGHHIDLGSLTSDVSQQPSLEFDSNGDRIAVLPPLDWGSRKFHDEYAAYMTSRGHRVTLSGFGGEQPTGGGGVPTPTLELQNLLVRGRFLKLSRQLKAWALKMREHRVSLLWKAICQFFPANLVAFQEFGCLQTSFVRRNHSALCPCSSRTKLFGPLPSFQRHISVLDCERRLTEQFALDPAWLREIRFPFLDRDLREFAYAIPWDQTIRVGQRRSLMRRALFGVVPNELLSRRHGVPLSLGEERRKELLTQWRRLFDTDDLATRALGIIDLDRLSEVLQKVQRGQEVHTTLLKRTLTLESWLRRLLERGVLAKPISAKKAGPSLILKNECPSASSN
jgi:asparagine synthase (glutamine-hydrolysing)